MKKNFYFSKIFVITFLIFITFLLYVFYRNFFYYPESSISQYYIYYLFSVILFLISLITLFLNEEKQKIFLLFNLSVLFGCYLFELYENINNKTWKNIYSSKGKTKYDIIYEEKRKKKLLYTPLPPLEIKINNKIIHTLSGIGDVNNIHCNEMGYFSKYKSDKYGFNNPDNNYWEKRDIEYLLVGDSFAHGNCVNENDTIAGNIKKLSKKVLINIGYAGSGPLLEYARLREYFPEKGAKKIIWLYCPNDLYDLQLEMDKKILQNYIKIDTFSQNLKIKSAEINQELKFIHNNLFEKYENKNYFLNILKLEKLRFYFNYYFPKKYDYETFEKIMGLANNFAKEKEAQFYFVYITTDIKNKNNFVGEEKEKILDIVKKLDIPIIDLDKEVFKEGKNIQKLFPENMRSHYSPLGNSEVAKAILKKIN